MVSLRYRMIEMDQVEIPAISLAAAHIRLDILCLRTAIANYAEAELRGNPEDSHTNSTLRSWARGLWRIGSNVLLRSDPNGYSIQLLHLLSHYGSGWISINSSKITGQGSLRRSLSVLSSHGLIRTDFNGQLIKIQGLHLLKEIQDRSQSVLRLTFDLDMIQDLLKVLNSPPSESGKRISSSRHIGLTFTLKLVLGHPNIKWTPEFHTIFDQWMSELQDNSSHELNDVEKWVMSAGIELYKGPRSFHFRTLEILFLLRSVSRSRSTLDGQNTRSGTNLEEEKGLLDIIMSKAGTYMTLAETALRRVIVVVEMPEDNPSNPQCLIHLKHYSNHLHPRSVPSDYAEVCKGLRELTLTLTTTPPLEQLITFFMSGWNSWKYVVESAPGRVNADNLGSISFAGILDCLTKEGRTEEILTLVNETKEYLSQEERVFQFKPFFPQLVTGHANSLHANENEGDNNTNRRGILLVELLESYLMCIYKAQDYDPRPPEFGYRGVQVSQGVLPYLFNCLATLGRYQTLHGIVTDLGSHLKSWTTDVTVDFISLYVHLPGALLASIKDLDFPTKEAMLEETYGVAKTLVKKTLDLGAYENIQKLVTDPMEGLINFDGMVHELTGFFGELEVSLLNKYGEHRLGPITTTILYFGDRVTDGLEGVGTVKMANCDWSVFMAQVKCCVLKWTQRISTPTHACEKKFWMDGMAESISRNCDLYLQRRSSVSKI